MELTTAEKKIAAQQTPPYDGIKVKLGQAEVIVPPLKASQMRKYAEALNTIAKFDDQTSIVQGLDISVPVIVASLARNYPDITAEDTEDLLDASTYRTVLRAIMGQSGFRQAAPGEK